MRAFLAALVLGLWIAFTLAPGAAEDATTPPAPQPAVADQPTQPPLTEEDKADIEIGKSAAAEVEKKFKLVEDSPDLPRISDIVEKLRPVTQKPYLTYQLKLVDSREINAFSLPGGYIYYTQGLLAAVESDDELAAVAAHEMAHVCLMHSRRLMSKDERYQRLVGSLLLVSILSHAEGVNAGAVATIGGLVAEDALNHYGREAELEADDQAILYLRDSKQYNPVAMLTVVEGLAKIESSQAMPDMGVFQTHPYGRDRAAAVTKRLEELGIPIERRRVTHALVAEAAVAKGDREIGELRLNGRVVFQPAVEVEGVSAVGRAEQSAEILNRLLLANLQLLEIEQMAEGDSVSFRARGKTILTITPEDAAFHESKVSGLGDQAMAALRLGFQQEKLQRAY